MFWKTAFCLCLTNPSSQLVAIHSYQDSTTLESYHLQFYGQCNSRVVTFIRLDTDLYELLTDSKQASG